MRQPGEAVPLLKLQNETKMTFTYNQILFATATVILLGASACTIEPAPSPLNAVPAATQTGGGGAGNTGDDDEPVINGNVSNSSQSTVANATVMLLNEQGTSVYEQTLSDTQGNFSFAPAAGTYRLLVNASGYAEVVTDTLSVQQTIAPQIVLP